MDCKQIIMNFTTPPSLEDLEVIARDAIETLPAELGSFCENMEIRIDDFADDATLEDMEVEDPYELLAIFRSGNEIAPGIEKKVSNDDDVLILYRLPLLGLWCETGEDLGAIVRQTMINEIGQNFDFSEDEIEDMTRRALL
jgi:predicted Zn-dependent protease with MMP-like domain